MVEEGGGLMILCFSEHISGKIIHPVCLLAEQTMETGAQSVLADRDVTSKMSGEGGYKDAEVFPTLGGRAPPQIRGGLAGHPLDATPSVGRGGRRLWGRHPTEGAEWK